jgi:hypothetical protein
MTAIVADYQGLMFANFLLEIASHGFMVISNGPIKLDKLGATSKVVELIKSIDWVTTNTEVSKYGPIETNNIAVAGQSCGGLNAVCLTASIHSRL